jgi:hypothetical protein
MPTYKPVPGNPLAPTTPYDPLVPSTPMTPALPTLPYDPYLPAAPQPAPVDVPQRGCICPPGANIYCQSPTCPRKGWGLITTPYTTGGYG